MGVNRQPNGIELGTERVFSDCESQMPTPLTCSPAPAPPCCSVRIPKGWWSATGQPHRPSRTRLRCRLPRRLRLPPLSRRLPLRCPQGRGGRRRTRSPMWLWWGGGAAVQEWRKSPAWSCVPGRRSWRRGRARCRPARRTRLRGGAAAVCVCVVRVCVWHMHTCMLLYSGLPHLLYAVQFHHLPHVSLGEGRLRVGCGKACHVQYMRRVGMVVAGVLAPGFRD